MSRIDDIKEQFKSVATNLGHKIQETSFYIQLQDRYQSYSPSSQKLIRTSGFLIFIFILILYPMMLYFSSQETITAFEDKRNLIRELFRTYREASARPQISIPPHLESLRSSIQNILTSANLAPEQKLGVNEASIEGKIIPKNLITSVLEVKLAKLNLKQVVDIGANLVGLSDSVKMKDINISAHSSETGYFDVTYKLYTLNVPEPAPEPIPEPEPKKGSSNKTETEKGDEL